jgi:hypothetical protein
MPNSHFHHASDNGLIVLPENPKTVSIIFPAAGVILNILVEGELGCIELKQALIQVGSDASMICPQ